LAGFPLAAHVESCRANLQRWAELVASGRIDSFKEQEVLADFLTDVFCNLLGYTRPADGHQRYTISREKHVQVDGKFADAVLGEFPAQRRAEFTPPHHRKPEFIPPSPAEKYLVALEGKGPKDPLERPYAGRRMSAVDQGYRYAINLPCDWIVVTSIRQTRVYFKGADQQTYERFDTEDLADNPNELQRFVFLLGAERVVPPAGRCHLYDLLAESEKVGRDLTKEFYLRYADIRQDAFEQISRDNPQVARHDVLTATQKLLDRILFCAFCEDRGLLPTDTIRKTYEHRDPYRPRPIWETFGGLFQAINRGNAALGIHAYNGGLFAHDPLLENLAISDDVCAYFRELGDYDYRPAHQAAYAPTKLDPSPATPPPSRTSGSRLSTLDSRHALIDVDILGHIFEQSITDLEKLRNELDGLAEPVSKDRHKSRRKKEGAFYTPPFVTRYIIEQALGGVLRERFESLRRSHAESAKGTARDALADPQVYTLDGLKKRDRSALVAFREAWQDELARVRLLDPACGSGAFLIEAFDQLHAAYQASNDRLEELRGHRTLFDLDKRILENNLYGVDLNEEAIEICRLSLWIKTAERGKALTSLDHTIRVGNSIVADPSVHPKAFDWRAEFPEVFAAGGFDVVVANPPYVRQELLGPIKPYLQSAYEAYHGMADLYVYFYELGIRLLKPGGLLSFIVTNKWMKSSYGEPLRRFFGRRTWIQSVVDFGHAKQIFEEADVFPSILVARRPTQSPKPQTARLCTIPREQLRIDDLSRQIEEEGAALPQSQLGTDVWQLEPIGVNELRDKIKAKGVPLAQFAGVKPCYGIKTGCNEAFLIDAPTREAIVSADPASAEVIKPYLRGQDVDRWCSDWSGRWMIFARRGIKIRDYPSVLRHLENYRQQLEPKPKNWTGDVWPGRKAGRYCWYEIQDTVDYWREFDKPKIFYQVIQFHPCYAIDRSGMLGNDKTFFIPTDDLYLLAVLNSPLIWWHNWRTLTHLKDEALSPMGYVMESLPIARPSDTVRLKVEKAVTRVIEIAQGKHETRQVTLDWLQVEYEIAKPSLRLQSPIDLDSDGFVAEVKKARGKKKPLTAAGLKALREEYIRLIDPARRLAAEAIKLEHQISDLVNEAYGLTPAEVALLWQTAPPRMPLPDTTRTQAID
ncbi:MAG: class I SAM-dependent DNA methyltransferase, partial [Rhodopirellula sp.]|nr:class I SAM-dependent DNA methyltransferase [Rhodopirellula sp.]